MPKNPIHNSPYFGVEEWVDARTFRILGYTAAWMVDERIVRIGDLLRQLSGAPLIINNWSFAKRGQTIYDSSGYRAIWDPEGGQLSQHRCGRAGDFKSTMFKPRQLRDVVMDNKALFWAIGLTAMEDLAYTPTWLHLDCRPVIPGVQKEGEFLIVRPT